MFKIESGVVRFGAVMFVCAICLPAYGGYVITPLSGGMSKIEIDPRDSKEKRTFSLDIVLTSNAADTHLSSEFRVVFSEPGLEYILYAWGTDYTTGGIDDISNPFISGLPLSFIDAASYAPTSDVDLYFSNVTNDNFEFGVGTIMSLMLAVPSNWFQTHQGVYQVEVSVVPELFFDGSFAIPTTAGQVFLLNIPGPPALALLALVGAIRPRRRRL